MNDSSPRTLLSQLCDLLAARPLQGLVYEDERPLPLASGPLAPMLEFVSAQTGLPIVAVGGGAALGRVPQVMPFTELRCAHVSVALQKFFVRYKKRSPSRFFYLVFMLVVQFC